MGKNSIRFNWPCWQFIWLLLLIHYKYSSASVIVLSNMSISVFRAFYSALVLCTTSNCKVCTEREWLGTEN